MVNERVGSGNWESGNELGDTWVSRNAYSYGRGNERGQARPEVLAELLKTTDRVVQEVDSVEYGLSDIQECAYLPTSLYLPSICFRCPLLIMAFDV